MKITQKVSFYNIASEAIKVESDTILAILGGKIQMVSNT